MADEAQAGGALTPGLLHAGPPPTHRSHRLAAGASTHAHALAHTQGHAHVHAHAHTVVVPADGSGGAAPLATVVTLDLPPEESTLRSPLGHTCDARCAGEGAVKYARHARPCAGFLFVPAISNLSVQCVAWAAPHLSRARL